MRKRVLTPLALVATLLSGGALWAEEAPAMVTSDDANVLWTCLAAFLVFFMQAGFSFVESGFTRAKNVCNILMKNICDFSFGSLVFWAVGFGLMFGLGTGYFGTSSFFFDPTATGPEGKTFAEIAGTSTNFGWAFLIFQTVFAATAATIVSGAVAERTRFVGYIVYSILITAIVYPVFGHWCWGSLYFGDASAGWLESMSTPFLDFAGSTVVHSVGAWAALAGAIVLGPRLGKYRKDGKPNPIPGHNMAMGALGVFILWLGWFGFNAGSTTAIDGGAIAPIAVVTNLSAAAGAVGAMVMSWTLFKKPDISMTLNGALAGLVAITAGCDIISAPWAVVTGMVAGGLVVLSVLFFEKIKIDDPVGAISVHGVCGAWGTIAIGFFGAEVGLLMGGDSSQLVAQLIGVGACIAWTLPASLIVFLGIKYTIGLRVSPEEEQTGLDITEHGLGAYHGDIPAILGPTVDDAAPAAGGVTAPAES